MHPECKYCDNPMPPTTIEDEVICSRCCAEWADAKIMVEDEEIEENDSYDGDEDCNEDNYDEDEDEDEEEEECLECGNIIEECECEED